MQTPEQAAFPAARFIKEIGRGKQGARSLSYTDARELYAAMLEARVSDLEMGAILLALRIKGESVDEIAGFLDAAEHNLQKIHAPENALHAPVLIPSYNGARNKANLTPLLALLLARHGVPVLVHGVLTDPGRVTTAEIFSAMGINPALSRAEAEQQLQQQIPAFMAIETLSPAMARLLAYRHRLGVRSSTHTLVKILQPFHGPALRLVSYTHPEYAKLMHDFFSHHVSHERGDAFLMRATEGETVANSGRAQQLDWLHRGNNTTLIYRNSVQLHEIESELPARDAQATAGWIQSVLDGEIPVPHNIAAQVEHCILVSGLLR